MTDTDDPMESNIGKYCILEVDSRHGKFKYQGFLRQIVGEELHFESKDGDRKMIQRSDVRELTAKPPRT